MSYINDTAFYSLAYEGKGSEQKIAKSQNKEHTTGQQIGIAAGKPEEGSVSQMISCRQKQQSGKEGDHGGRHERDTGNAYADADADIVERQGGAKK